MNPRSILILFVAAALTACGGANVQSTQKEVSFGDVSVSWSDIRASEFLANAIPMPEGESAYMFVGVKQGAPGGTTGLSLNQLIELGERSVKSEGSCDWLGYDREFDQRVRATGSLASSSDERLFFARLRCS